MKIQNRTTHKQFVQRDSHPFTCQTPITRKEKSNKFVGFIYREKKNQAVNCDEGGVCGDEGVGFAKVGFAVGLAGGGFPDDVRDGLGSHGGVGFARVGS